MTFFKRSENGNRHRHEFLVKFPEATAIYAEKRNREPLMFRGTVRQCPSCGQYRFRAPGLPEVEVTH